MRAINPTTVAIMQAPVASTMRATVRRKLAAVSDAIISDIQIYTDLMQFPECEQTSGAFGDGLYCE